MRQPEQLECQDPYHEADDDSCPGCGRQARLRRIAGLMVYASGADDVPRMVDAIELLLEEIGRAR